MSVLDLAFSPRSIAVVGASSNPDSRTNQNFLRPLLAFGCKARVYPVNPYLSEVVGLKAYASIQDIPEAVDYVICAVPAPLTPQVMQDCAAARVRVVAIFTAGFSETGEEIGRRLERDIVDIARHSGVRVIGPNCLGVHCPKSGMSLEADIPRRSGHVGFISQSGGNAKELILAGAEHGIFFSKVVSYGNAADLNEADFLEYFARDKDTRIIAAYIEGIKQPQRFVKALKEAVAAKPVIILKGGKTEAGAGAAISHTGALSGSKDTWDALCRQTGTIQAGNLEEIADAILAFSLLKPPRGKRIGIIGIGGGASVQAADDCESCGLILPAFPDKIRQELRKFAPPAGTGFRNPIDASAEVYWNPASLAETISLVANWDGVDALFVMLSATATLRRGIETLRAQIEAVIEVGMRSDKPLAIVLRTGNIARAEEMAREVEERCVEAGFPVYPSCSRAAQAISRLICYHEERRFQVQR